MFGLEEFVNTTPFNNGTKYLELAGVSYDSRFGNNCVGNLMTLAGNLLSGWKLGFLKNLDSSRPHYASVLYNDTGARLFVDPYLLHNNPIELGMLTSDHVYRSNDALPKGRRVNIKLESYDILNVWLDTKWYVGYRLLLQHSYNLGQIVFTAPDICTYTLPNPESIYMRTLGNDGILRFLIQRLRPDKERYAIVADGRERKVFKPNHNMRSYDEVVDKIAMQVDQCRKDLHEFFDEASYYATDGYKLNERRHRTMG